MDQAGDPEHNKTSAAPLPTGGGMPFGATLEPGLRAACGGKLSKVTWFRTRWQRGGALTGYATWEHDDGRLDDVVVKLPVPPRERHWLVALQPPPPPEVPPETSSGASPETPPETSSKTPAKVSLAPEKNGGAYQTLAAGAPRDAANQNTQARVGRGDSEVLAAGPTIPREMTGVVPWVYAHGEALGPYDFAWVVMERLAYGPLGAAWGGGEFDLIVEAAGRFYEATAGVAIDPAWKPRRRDWPSILAAARKQVQTRGVSDSQRWKASLKRAHKKLDGWITLWDARGRDDWCHGDLHLGNAMSRHAPPPGSSPESHLESPPLPKASLESPLETEREMPGKEQKTPTVEQELPGAKHKLPRAERKLPGGAVLIDLAEVRVGHWVEDAVYLEHLYWSARHQLGGRKLVSMVAQQRKQRGLSVGENWPKLAKIKRALLAIATATRFHEVSVAHAAAALVVLEREVRA